MTFTSETFKKEINDIRNKPTRMLGYSLDLVKQISEGEHIVVDANSPFVTALSIGAMMGAEAVDETVATARGLYPILAQNLEDLSPHIREQDRVDRFALPSETSFTILMSVQELRQTAVDAGDGSRRLTIPRNTVFTAGNVPFTMEYPLEIKILPHGGIQCSYNTDRPSPITVLENLTPDWMFVSYNNIEMIRIRPRVKQLLLTKTTEAISPSMGFNKDFTYDNYFHYIRILYRDKDGVEQEMAITHTDDIYDPDTPTALVRVLDATVRVVIPAIYLSKGLVTSTLDTYIYTTLGPLSIDLGQTVANTIKAEWDDRYSNEFEQYSAPLGRLSTLNVSSDALVEGGRGELSFDEMKRRVTQGGLVSDNTPITENQLQLFLNDRSYDVNRYIDNTTELIYLASKAINVPNATIPQAAGAVMPLLSSTNDLRQYSTVYRTDNAVVITPSSLMVDDGEGLRLLSDSEVAELEGLRESNPTALVNLVNSAKYLYTPFYYVLDTEGDVLDVRAYHLDNPHVTTRNTIRNDSFIEVNSVSPTLVKTDSGFTLMFGTHSGSGFMDLADEDIQVQLSFTPAGESQPTYVVAQQIAKDDKSRYYRVDLDSDFEIDTRDRINITNSKMFDATSSINVPTSLVTQLRLTFTIFNSDIQDAEGISMNHLAAPFLLPSGLDRFDVVTEETFTVKFGEALNMLWRPSRSYAGLDSYQTYSEDIYERYAHDVYELNEFGKPLLTTVDGFPQFNILHRANEIMEDSEGNPVLRYAKGDLIRDAEGNPILDALADIVHSVDLHVVDAKYYFLSTDAGESYRDALPDSITDSIEDDLGQLNARTLAGTQLFYKAQQGLGGIQVLADEDTKLFIDAEQSLSVTLYVPVSVNRDVELKREMTAGVATAVKQALDNTLVSVDLIVESIRDTLGDDAKGIKLEGFGGDHDISTITQIDPTKRLTLAKRLVVSDDDRVGIVESLSVFFNTHGE